MIPISLADTVAAVAGTAPWLPAAANVMVTGDVVHDSRQVVPGDLFVAIVGESHDGHAFVADALAAGAVAAIVSKPTEGPTIEVADTVTALGLLAHAVLARSPRTRVVALTGSSGKTSTKDMLAAVFGSAGTTVAPAGSFNNELGLPMTVLSITAETQWLVLEMGARSVGHIQTLCEIAAPDVGMVLNVGSAHVGEFGGADKIAEAKSELVTALRPNGIAVLNADDPRVSAMAEATSARVWWFGSNADCHVQIVSVELDELARPTVLLRILDELFTVALQTHGAHQALNAAAAATAAAAVGIPAAEIVDALTNARAASRWRMEVTETADGVTVVNDAYNANPESMAAALQALASIGTGRKTWAVLGEMLELGDDSLTAHDATGRLALRLGIDRVIGVGPGARRIVLGAANEGYFNGEAQSVPDLEAAAALLKDGVEPGDVVLFKASRAVGLERLADSIIEDHGGSTA